MAEPREVKTLEERERLQQHRPLSPEPRLGHLVAVSVGRKLELGRPLHTAAIGRKVGGGDQASCVLHGPGDPLRDVAAVEAVTCRVDRGTPTSGEIPLLVVDESPEGAREFRLAEDATYSRYSALGSL